MASEAQRIMNLSLTKIVSSRSRRGGVSLHKNLLVASVLFKARDVYAAEMAGLVVIRDGFVYDRDAVDVQKQETDDVSNETGSPLTDDSRIPEEQIMETVNAVVLNPVSPPTSTSTSNPSQTHELCEAVDKNLDSDQNNELDNCKENIEPTEPGQKPTEMTPTFVKPKRSRKLPSKQCRKRKYTEVEQAVLSISENDDSQVPDKISRVSEITNDDDNTILDCHELSSTLPDWGDNNRVGTNNELTVTGNQYCPDMSTEYQSCTDISKNTYLSCMCDEDDQSIYDDLDPYKSGYHNYTDDCCSNPPCNDNITFALSHSMLVVSV